MFSVSTLLPIGIQRLLDGQPNKARSSRNIEMFTSVRAIFHYYCDRSEKKTSFDKINETCTLFAKLFGNSISPSTPHFLFLMVMLRECVSYNIYILRNVHLVYGTFRV